MDELTQSQIKSLLRFFVYGMEDINFDYHKLTTTEQKLISFADFTALSEYCKTHDLK